MLAHICALPHRQSLRSLCVSVLRVLLFPANRKTPKSYYAALLVLAPSISATKAATARPIASG